MKAIIVYKKMPEEFDELKINGQICMSGKSLLQKNIENLHRSGIFGICYVTPEETDYSETEESEKIVWQRSSNDFGTAGLLKSAAGFIGDDPAVLFLENDKLYDFDWKTVPTNGSDTVCLLVSRVENPVGFSSVVCDESGKIVEFRADTFPETILSDTVFSGAAWVNREAIREISDKTYVDFAKDYLPAYRKRHEIFGQYASGGFFPLRNVGEYRQYHLSSGGNVPVSVDVSGNDVKRSCFGVRTVMGKNGIVIDSVIGKDCRIGDNVRLIRCTVADGAKVGDGAAVYDGCIVGHDTSVPKDTIVPPNHLVKTDAHNAYIVSNINGLDDYGLYFENAMLKGELTGDLTDRIGHAISRYFGGTCVVGCAEGCDPKKFSLIGGALTGGCDVLDIGTTDEWILRYAVRTYGLNFGLYLSPEGLVICESDGLNVTLASREEIRKRFKENYVSMPDGKYRTLGGTERMYKRKLKHYLYDMPAFKASLDAPSFFSDNVVCLPHRDTERLSVRNKVTSDGFSDEFLDCAVLYAYGKTFGRAYVPEEYVFCAEEIGSKYGFYVERIPGEGDQRRFLYDMTDPYVRGAVLVRYLAKNDLTLRAIRRMMPDVFVTTRRYDLSRDSRSVLPRINLDAFADKDRSVRLEPTPDLYGVRIIAQASAAEISETICEDVVKKIKSVEKNNLTNK